MPSALFLSPHLDDAAFSCGGTASLLAAEGWRTVLCTVFTRSVPEPQGFALACQLDKGLGPEIDYMALRRDEDAVAAARLGAETLWLDLPEAPHRGYRSAAMLFGAFAPEDRIEAELWAVLGAVLADHSLIFAPQALGDHVDHRRVRDVVIASPAAARTVWYRDLPYAARHPASSDPDPVPIMLTAAALAAKLDACAAYRSQLGFQFGGEVAMRDRLTRFAHEEAARLGAPAGPAEAVQAAPDVAALLDGVIRPR